jgi:hypothetical protein
MPRQSSLRNALSLLEVVLALAILAGSFATLAQLVGLGMRAAGNGRDLAQAQLLADSVMSEITAGVLPAESLNQVPLDMHPGWLVSTAIETTIHQGILRVTVLVERDSTSLRRAHFEVSRWIRDPSIALPVEDETTSSQSSSSGSSGSAGTSGSSASGGSSAGGGAGGSGGGARGGSGGGARGGSGGGARGGTGGTGGGGRAGGGPRR